MVLPMTARSTTVKNEMPRSSADREGDGPIMDLDRFLPYRLSVLANGMNRALAHLYEDRFGISVGEWRLIAILARFGPLCANGVCQRAEMDKVRVSRAVARAVSNGLVNRAIDPEDRRRSVLTLTAKGRAVHDRIVPLALEQEAMLTQPLMPDEMEQLFDMIGRLHGRAEALRTYSDDMLDAAD